MTYNIVFSPQVLEQIDETCLYLEVFHGAPQAAKKLMEQIQDVLEAIAENPYLHAAVSNEARFHGELRRALAGRYKIFYFVDESKQTVNVVEFRHGARR